MRWRRGSFFLLVLALFSSCLPYHDQRPRTIMGMGSFFSREGKRTTTTSYIPHPTSYISCLIIIRGLGLPWTQNWVYDLLNELKQLLWDAYIKLGFIFSLAKVKRKFENPILHAGEESSFNRYRSLYFSESDKRIRI